jgi:UPF0716 protein FxsA
MKSFPVLLLFFLLVPLVEIYLLIQMGGVIGALPTVFLVVFTAVLGAALVRFQGFSTLQRLQATLGRGGVPAVEMMEGVILLVSAVLLLTPGFVTDAIGFAGLVPVLRRTLAKKVLTSLMQRPGGFGPPPPDGPRTRHTIEGEFRREDD